MTGVILRKELVEFTRDRRFLGLAVVLFLLTVAAAIDGANRANGDAAAREAAEFIDREVWVEQGDNNPHGAAHFARYAFRQTPALAAFDPGIFDHAGAAFWMEAHTQNPTTLRRAEDAAVQAPFPAMSPAWIMQTIGTLAIAVLLFPALAGEREQGTLKSLSAAGVGGRSLAVGKTGAVLIVVAGILLVLFIVVLVPVFIVGGSAPEFGRITGLAVLYSIALFAFALTILWLSARATTMTQAFGFVAFFWLFVALAWPAVAAQVAVAVYPDIHEQELKNDIQLQAQTPFWAGDAQESAVAAYQDGLVKEFDVESFESLGFNQDAVVLQAHEEFANAVYDRLYEDLNTLHAGQDSVLRYASVLSPVLAIKRISSGLAGTDLLAQQRFALDAEQHRRRIIEQLNRDMMIHAGDEGYAYMAGRDLWESIPDFRASAPGVPEILRFYLFEICVLLAWTFLAGAAALHGVRQALTGAAK